VNLFSRRRDPRAVPERSLDLAVGRSMVRNLVVAPTGVWAGYRLGPQAWSFKAADQQWALIEQCANRWAQLSGLHFTELVTARPYPVRAWAERLDARTPHPLKDADGSFAGWNDHLARQQSRIATAGMDDTVTFRFVRVGDTPKLRDFRSCVLGGCTHHDVVPALLAAERRVREVLAGPGLSASPATEQEMGWLRHRAIAPGVPAPGRPALSDQGWQEDFMGEFTDGVEWVQEKPLQRVVKVTAYRDGEEVTSYAAVLALGRMERLAYPEAGLEPWQVFGQRVRDQDGHTFPVEWLSSGQMVAGDDLKGRVEYDLNRAMHLRKDYLRSGRLVPRATDRAIDLAATIHDEVSTGTPVDSVRFAGVVCARVTGPTADVCLARARALADLYGGPELRMTLEHPWGQMAWLRGFVPGELPVRTGYQHQLSTRYLAAAMPAVRSRAGDGHGPYQGYTIGASASAVLHDSHYATEAPPRRANLWVWVGSPGCGKSFGMGKGAFETTVRGIRTLVNCPPGSLAKLLEHPLIGARNGVHIDLLQSPAGTLNPPGLIPDPPIEDGQELGEYDRARALAEVERGKLTTDAARMCLEEDLYAHPGTKSALREARAMVKWAINRSTWDLVDALRQLHRDKGNEHALDLAHALEEAAASPRTYLLFPPRGDATDQHTAITKTLAVITSRGLRLPDDSVPRGDWTHDELAAVPLTHLSTFFTTRHAYAKPMEERASLYLDEMKEPLRTGSGRALLSRLGSDSSKWNLEVAIASQNPEDVMKGDTLNYVAGAYVGHINERGVALASLPLLGIEDPRYAAEALALGAGQFMHRDIDGQVEKVQIDAEHLPELKALLLTDPRPEGAEQWNLADVLV